jgi:hypothetical protein
MSDKEKEKVEQEEVPEDAKDALPASYILITFEAPGSAKMLSLETREVTIPQITLAATELQGIVDFEKWWAKYAGRMTEMEEMTRKRVEQDMIREAINRRGGLKPN